MVAGRSGDNCSRNRNYESNRANRCFKTLSTNPFNYLVVPRVLAGIISLPILVFIGDIIGVLGGYLICTQVLNFNPVVYLQNTYNFVQFLDVFSGLVKACVFGFIITLMVVIMVSTQKEAPKVLECLQHIQWFLLQY